MGMGSWGYPARLLFLKRHTKAIRRENGSGRSVEQTGSILELSYATESKKTCRRDSNWLVPVYSSLLRLLIKTFNDTECYVLRYFNHRVLWNGKGNVNNGKRSSLDHPGRTKH